MAHKTWPFSGASWWKFDFHTHTPASKDWDKTGANQAPITPEQWLLRHMAAGIDCVAITDHNSGAWIDGLKSAYQKLETEQREGFRELHLFPGVELSVNGGVHLLAIFDTSHTTSDIDTLLGKVEYQGTKGDSDGVTRKSIVEAIEAVCAAGGIAIPAHVDEPKGLLRLETGGRASLDAQTLKQVFEWGRVVAMEVVNRAAPKPQVYQDAKCRWTEVLGTDWHESRPGTAPGSRFTWVKMGRPSLEGLRLALLDGERFSVRRSDDAKPFEPSHLPSRIVESIEITDGRYIGRGSPTTLRFSPWFNAIVGGRGTGKSTIVHALRLAYRREGELKNLPAENEARQTFERFIREPQNRNDPYGALDYKSDKRTGIAVTVHRDQIRYRLNWRQSATGATIQEEVNGRWEPSSSQSVSGDRFPIRIYSQGQIGGLAGESQEALLALIDEAAKTQPARDSLKQAKQTFLSLRASIRAIDAKLLGDGELRVNVEDVRRKLASFEGRQHAEILKAYQIRARQNREIDRQLDGAAELATRILKESENLSADDVPEGVFDPENEIDLAALDLTARLHAEVEEAANALQEAGLRLRSVAERERLSLTRSVWYVAVLEARTQYSLLTQELKQAGVGDPAGYGNLVQEQHRLEAESERLIGLRSERDRLIQQAATQRETIRSARREISRQRRHFLTTLASNSYVRIDLEPYGRNARNLEKQLRRELNAPDDRFEEDILVSSTASDSQGEGLAAAILKDLPKDVSSASTLIEDRLEAWGVLFEEACAGHGGFGGHFNNYLQREAEKRPEFLDRLLVWSPEDSLQVEYSPKGDGKDFRSILQASAGQRAAAMLAFLLAYGDEPMVLDQPEDDLDNHLIYELVVQQIRENKLRRQIIVVTHNPNIVVNGDAEMLHVMDFRSGQCKVLVKGSLQDRGMREEVCEVMEGGREAFERRYRRLGGETTGNV